MFRRNPEPGPAIRALCAHLAEARDVDYDVVVLEGPRTYEDWAFSFVKCGASLVLALAESEGYPGTTGRARRRGAKAVASTFGTDGALRSTVFMGHALFDHMAALQEAHDEHTSAQAYRNVRGVVCEVYPLELDDEKQLGECAAELRHLQQRTAPAVSHNGFHRAVRAGRDPFLDPELVGVQQRAVGTYFRRTAAAHAIELCVGSARFEELRPSFLWSDIPSNDGLVYSAGELATWDSVSEQFGDLVEAWLDTL